MPLEVFDFIKDLVATNPLGTDPKSEGDDHLRGVKSTLLKQFEGFTLGKPILLNEDQLNGLLSGRAGIMFDFAGATAPVGSLTCNGQELLKVDYPELYAAIGDLWNETNGQVAPDVDHFRIPVQFDSVTGFGLYRRGLGGATTVGEYQDDNNKAHTHTFNNALGGGNPVLRGGVDPTSVISNTGSSGGAEARPKSITTLTCIWTGQ